MPSTLKPVRPNCTLLEHGTTNYAPIVQTAKARSPGARSPGSLRPGGPSGAMKGLGTDRRTTVPVVHRTVREVSSL